MQRLISETPDIMLNGRAHPAPAATRTAVYCLSTPHVACVGYTCIEALGDRKILPGYSPFIHGGYMAEPCQLSPYPTVLSVLQYLDSMKRLAAWHNDPQAARHYEQCWAVVFEAVAGEYVSPITVCSTPIPATATPKPATKPKWFTDKFARPIREVVGREQRHCRDTGRGKPFTVSYDVLSCGHKLETQPTLPEQQPAKHRRCRECVKGVA